MKYLLLFTLILLSGCQYLDNPQLRMKRWEAFKAEWEPQGVRFDLESIIPPDVPSEENFAHIPLLKPIYDITWNEDFTEYTKNNPEEYSRTFAIIGYPRYSKPQRKIKRPPEWEKGEVTDLKAWQASFRDLPKRWDVPETPGDPASDVLYSLSKYESNMAELAKAARTLPYSRFDFEYSAIDRAPLLHSSVFIDASHTFSLRACVFVHQKKSAEALEDVLSGILIVGKVKDEPIPLSGLCYQTYTTQMLQPIWEGLKFQLWSTEQLQKLEQVLGDVDFLKNLELISNGDRITTIATLIDPKTKKWRDSASFKDDYEFEEIKSGQQKLADYNRFHFEVLQKAVDSKTQRIFPEILSEFDEEETYSFFIYGCCTDIAFRSAAYNQNDINMARIACRLEILHQEGKPYPEKLSELGDDIPHDVLTGESFRYNLTNDGRYRLYSIGWDLADDGGKIDKRVRGSKGDWVWQYTKVPLLEESGDE